MAELLFWPALLAYSEAAFAYLGDARRPGLPGRLATWGVRLGWLIQTALLALQATRAEGFPWSTWAGSLNLFVWLVVSAYLVWGCRARFRLLGLAVMPVAVVLLVLARAGGGTDLGGRAHASNLFLVLHVGLLLSAFAGFTLAAALGALFLWQERRLKRRERSILRLPAPSLAVLDQLSARSILVALPAFALGVVAGIVRLNGEHFAAVIALAALTLVVYGSYVALRFGADWRGRRSAWLAVGALALVAAVYSTGHFS